MALAAIGAAFGGELQVLADASPNLRRPAVPSVEQCKELALPDPDASPRLLFLREAVRRTAECADGVPVAIIVPGPADVPELIMGLEVWLETVLFDIAAAGRVLDWLIPWYIRLVNGFLADGASFVVMPCGLASTAVVSREITANFTRPVLAKVLAEIRGPVILHCAGAPLLSHLDLLTGLPSVVGFGMDYRDDLAESRRIAGPDAVLFGGPDYIEMAKISAEEAQRRCRDFLEERRGDPRFILSNSGPDIPWDTPLENIHAMRRAVESYGGSVP
jgi:uroporphyrinogen decarboxylase